MTNDELNRLCAERIGWKYLPERNRNYPWWNDALSPKCGHDQLPDYCGDFKSAHSLLDWLRANGWGISVFMEPDDTQCGVRLHRGRTIVEVGESFRVAVAKAFLEATK